MASKDNPPGNEQNFSKDSFRHTNYQRYTGGYNRRRNNSANNRFNQRKNDQKFNGTYYRYNQNINYNQDKICKNNVDSAITWRRIKSNDVVISQRESLVKQITECQYECMICCQHIDLDSAVWSCESCFNIFHIACIRRWSEKCNDEPGNTNWRCPACNKDYAIVSHDLFYNCYCGKTRNPCYNRSVIPHSCGELCGKRNKTIARCPHLCSILCHPGPCPVCESTLKTNCHCGKEEFIVKCTASENNLSCGSKCNKMLNCSVHICHELCHPNSCEPCQNVVSQSCCCGSTTRDMLCGSSESYEQYFTCENICQRKKDCGRHSCECKCHPGPCESCTWLPTNILTCPCGKNPLSALCDSRSAYGNRQTCVDPIPTCEEVCDRPYQYCEHKCPSKCHEGPCTPCPLTSDVKCRCNKTSQNMKCSEVASIMKIGESVRCTTRCKVKKLCGIHRCQDVCCDVQVHLCGQICGKALTCKKHTCDRPCHKGNCTRCDNVSFDELFCHCGGTKMLPPVPCGQEPPFCELQCSREHTCDHEVIHNCHNEVECPLCTVLMSKPCPGGHKTLYNIPCFRPVVTCGLPCQRPLENCDHLCTRVCHEGACTDPSSTSCTQLCTKPRPECGHPCGRPCHSGDCQENMISCQTNVELRCLCGLRTAHITCDKLDKINIMLKSDSASNKKDVADFFISNNSISLSCDSECKKAARTKQLSEAFECDSVSFDRMAYSSFLREFSIKNPEFLQQIDSTFCSLIKKLDTEKLKKKKHQFQSMNRDKRRFIQELSEYFHLSATIIESESKVMIEVEAVKGICKISGSRLIHFIQKNYPQLFRTDKPTSLRNVKLPLSSSNGSSYSGKMQSIGDVTKS